MPINSEGLFENTFQVQSEWVDYNGHMNMGFYLVALDFSATDPFFDYLGIGQEYLKQTNRSTFTLGSNIDYVHPKSVAETARIDCRCVNLLGHGKSVFVRTSRRLEGRASRVSGSCSCSTSPSSSS